MALFGWLRSRHGEEEKKRARWRDAWSRAADAEDMAQLPALQQELSELAAGTQDIELEEEMLDAARQLDVLIGAVAGGRLPVIETHHRIVGRDTCHFTAPASLPDDPAQPSGRVLLTSARSLFLGGTKGAAVPWHSVREVLRIDRDVLLVRTGGAPAVHFRFNSFTDALTAAFLARRLKSAAAGRGL
jgi:hypothetical protein